MRSFLNRFVNNSISIGSDTTKLSKLSTPLSEEKKTGLKDSIYKDKLDINYQIDNLYTKVEGENQTQHKNPQTQKSLKVKIESFLNNSKLLNNDSQYNDLNKNYGKKLLKEFTGIFGYRDAKKETVTTLIAYISSSNFEPNLLIHIIKKEINPEVKELLKILNHNIEDKHLICIANNSDKKFSYKAKKNQPDISSAFKTRTCENFNRGILNNKLPPPIENHPNTSRDDNMGESPLRKLNIDEINIILGITPKTGRLLDSNKPEEIRNSYVSNYDSDNDENIIDSSHEKSLENLVKDSPYSNGIESWKSITRRLDNGLLKDDKKNDSEYLEDNELTFYNSSSSIDSASINGNASIHSTNSTNSTNSNSITIADDGSKFPFSNSVKRDSKVIDNYPAVSGQQKTQKVNIVKENDVNKPVQWQLRKDSTNSTPISKVIDNSSAVLRQQKTREINDNFLTHLLSNVFEVDEVDEEDNSIEIPKEDNNSNRLKDLYKGMRKANKQLRNSIIDSPSINGGIDSSLYKNIIESDSKASFSFASLNATLDSIEQPHTAQISNITHKDTKSTNFEHDTQVPILNQKKEPYFQPLATDNTNQSIIYGNYFQKFATDKARVMQVNNNKAAIIKDIGIAKYDSLIPNFSDFELLPLIFPTNFNSNNL